MRRYWGKACLAKSRKSNTLRMSIFREVNFRNLLEILFFSKSFLISFIYIPFNVTNKFVTHILNLVSSAFEIEIIQH